MSKRKQNNSPSVMLNEVKHPDLYSGFAGKVPAGLRLFASLRMTIMLVLSLLIFSSTTLSQPFTDEEKKILEMQDKRIANHDISWINIIDNPEKILINQRSSLALININDSIQVNEIINAFNNTNDEERKILYLVTLLYIDSDISRNFLLSLLKENENYGELVFAILQNIGDDKSLEKVIQHPMTRGAERSEFFNLIYAYSKKRIGSIAAFEKVKQLYDSTSNNNGKIAYALNRTAIIPAISLFKDELRNNFSSPKYTTRMWSYSAIGKLLDTTDVNSMLSGLATEQDWRVKVNIVNALGNYKIDNTSPLLTEVTTTLLNEAVNGDNTHVSIVAWQALAKLFAGADIRDMLANNIKEQALFVMTPGKAIDWQVKVEVIKAYAKIFKDEAKADLFALFTQTDNYDIKAAVVSSFGNMNDAMVYKELRDSISNDVMRYNAIHPNKDGSMIGSSDLAKMYKGFVEALAELDNRLEGGDRNTIRLIFSEFASSKNAPIVDICLTNLQDSMYLQYRSETCQIMMFDYDGFKYPQDKDVAIMYIEAWGKMGCTNAIEQLTQNLKNSDYDIAKASADALKNITGKDYEKEINAPKYKHDFDWEFIDNLKNKKFAAIQTNKGRILIELAPEIAPFTVQSFVKLGEMGFYNNTVFHRVVPNFVIQGGDPTGSGYEGPGYSIRSEFSPLPYEAYTVGMASSGKDTEGSQFFITHSPQPHLDGRYTIFGNVVDGFEVVDKIQVGDWIESISFNQNK